MAKILVVDDNDGVRKKITKTLKENGYEVSEASDGEMGLSILKKIKFDLLLLDVIMPNKGGIESLFMTKNIYPDMKIIFITGKVPQESEAFKSLAKVYDVKDIIYKPFKKTELLSKVRTYIS